MSHPRDPFHVMRSCAARAISASSPTACCWPRATGRGCASRAPSCRCAPTCGAIAELGRIAKTLHLLSWIDSEDHRRQTSIGLNRHEGRHRVARVIFHGNEGHLRQPYRDAQEDQLGALGFALNALVLWNAQYMNDAIEQLHATGHEILDGDLHGSRRSLTNTSSCSATSPSSCPTNSPPDNADRYAHQANRPSVRSCSIITGAALTGFSARTLYTPRSSGRPPPTSI